MKRVRYFHRVTAQPHVAGITPPSNSVLPVITGDVAGEESSTSNGTWSNAVTFVYQWYLDDSPLTGETASTIETDAEWIDQTLSVVVSAGNGAGRVSVSSAGIVLT